jgi:hypothetical protein
MTTRQPSRQASVHVSIHSALLVYFESALQKETATTTTPFVLQRFFFNRLLPCGREDSTSMGFIPAEKVAAANGEMFAVQDENHAASLRSYNGLRDLHVRLRIRTHESNLEGRVHLYLVCGGAPA